MKSVAYVKQNKCHTDDNNNNAVLHVQEPFPNILGGPETAFQYIESLMIFVIGLVIFPREVFHHCRETFQSHYHLPMWMEQYCTP